MTATGLGPLDPHWVQRPGSRPGGLVRPSTVEEAAEILAADPQLRPVAGGTDLILELARDGKGEPVDLLDMTGIAGFGALTTTADGVMIGAGVTHNDALASSELNRDGLIALRQACLEIGSPQLRNRATIVGNLVTASPANDTISALMALGAEVHTAHHVAGELTTRTIKLDEFYDDFRSTVLGRAELVTSIAIAAPEHERRGIWVKAGLRKAQAISVVHAGLVIELGDDGAITTARIALGSVGPTVALSEPAAQTLIGSNLDATTIASAAQAAADSVTPIDDGRATAGYRRSSVFTVVSRGLKALAAQQQEVRWPRRVPLLSTRLATTRQADAHPEPRRTVDTSSEVQVTVNGTVHRAGLTGMGTLLDWLRETAGTGTKEGCAEGECGACTVQLDGDAVMSCLVPASQADGADVTTVEGLASADQPSPMQQAFVDKFAVQCGYCIPGFIVAGETLAAELDGVPTREEIELALSGNLCRCTGYYNIIDAVLTAIQSGRS